MWHKLSFWCQSRWNEYFEKKHPLRSEDETRQEVEKEYEKVGRGVAAQKTHHPLIARGRFLTKKDLQRRRQERCSEPLEPEGTGMHLANFFEAIHGLGKKIREGGSIAEKLRD